MRGLTVIIPTIPDSIRHQCHLVLQAAKYGADIVTIPGRDGYTTIDGERCSLLQEWTVNLLCTRRLRLLSGESDGRSGQVELWTVTITEAGRAVLSEWDAQVWGTTELAPEPTEPADCLSEAR